MLRSMRKAYGRSIIAVASVVGLTIVAAIGLRVTFAPYHVPSSSMMPTLPVSSYIWANRFARSPKRGDVIVFGFPEDPRQDFVKRVIAVGGDKLEVHDGHPSINGWTVPSCVVGTYSYTDEDSLPPKHDGEIDVEFLGAHAYLIFLDAGRVLLSTGPFVAKPDEVWVLGDNRMNSHDSPMWFGGAGAGVPHELVRGRLVGHDTPTLPPDASPALHAALEDCLRKRPAQTSPPR